MILFISFNCSCLNHLFLGKHDVEFKQSSIHDPDYKQHHCQFPTNNANKKTKFH